MTINKDTKCCISIAERPGNFGSTIFNAGFEALSLDFFYKPFKVTEDGLAGAIEGIRSLGIRGCGVSMPHKVKAIKLLDKIDPVAQKIGAINTIVNDDGVLSGYNTDFEGAKRALGESYNVAKKKVLIIGAGGVSRAVILALKENGAGKIYLTNRSEEKGKSLAKEFDINYLDYAERNDFKGGLFVNATSVGMKPQDKDMIIDEDSIVGYDAVMDVVVYPFKTALIKEAERQGKVAIPGFKMSLYQAAAQFKLYTGKNASLEIMAESIKKF